MNKRLKIVSLFFLFALGTLTIWRTTRWLVRAQSHQKVGASARLPEPYARVDEKAGAVKGGDEVAIRELADAVLLLAIGDNVPTLLINPFKERVVHSEISYRRGQKGGIPEINVVRLIEELARKLNAPEYARTDEDEVREMRLAISYMMPRFIAHQPSGEQTQIQEPSINPTMSPLEAVYVTRFLIMQKEINESSQITPAERAELKARIKELADRGFQLTWQERGAVMRALIAQKLYPEKPQLTAEELAARVQLQTAERAKNQARAFLSAGPSSARHKEMQEVFRRAHAMNVVDAVALTNRSLELLGIEE